MKAVLTISIPSNDAETRSFVEKRGISPSNFTTDNNANYHIEGGSETFTSILRGINGSKHSLRIITNGEDEDRSVRILLEKLLVKAEWAGLNGGSEFTVGKGAKMVAERVSHVTFPNEQEEAPTQDSQERSA